MYLFSGNENKVIIPTNEVDAFNRTWSCSELRSRSYWFEFDSNGDLIDTDMPEQDDGSAASALANDAKEFWLDS